MKQPLGVLDSEVDAADAVPLERARALRRAIDETYFKAELAAGTGVYEGAVTEPKNGDEVVMRFPAAAAGTNAHVQRSIAARPLWVKTRPRLWIWYTSPVGSTNAFSIRFVLRVFGAGSTTVNNIFTVDFTPGGPAAAGGILTATVVGSAVFPTSPYGVAQLRVGRLGGDANPNALDILLAQIVFEEIA